jgi:hypothetical protein
MLTIVGIPDDKFGVVQLAKLSGLNGRCGMFKNFKSYFDGYELEFFKLISDPNRGVNSIAEQIFKRLKRGYGAHDEDDTFGTYTSKRDKLRDLEGRLGDRKSVV